MLAIYHVEESSPYQMYCLEISKPTIDEFEKAVRENEYPNAGFTEVLIVDNNKIVAQLKYPEWE